MATSDPAGETADDGHHHKLECGTSLAESEFSVPENDDEGHQQQTVHSKRIQDEKSENKPEDDPGMPSSLQELRSKLASDVITDGTPLTLFPSPFERPIPKGSPPPTQRSHYPLPLVYCDQTASNRPVESVEQYLHQVALPLYGNTHTNTSITGSQSTALVAEARQIVAESCNAKVTGKAALDVVLFAGNGTTSAVHLLIDVLGLRAACRSSKQQQEQRPIVFVGPYEHHSNLIPWRESGAEIVMVPEDEHGNDVDFEALERLLQQYDDHKGLKMGTFTAASNVTGKLSDVNRIATTLHRHQALAFFDYATGASYLHMDMNPPPCGQYPNSALLAKDAIYLSPHKMLGGVGTPGVLVVKKHLVNQVNAPSRSGGGTVFYVTHQHHRFLSNRLERYEGGTPNVTGIFRVGLAFLLKRRAEACFAQLAATSNSNSDRVEASTSMVISQPPPRTMQEYDCQTYAKVVGYLKEHAPNLVLLGYHQGGGNNNNHLPIFSFLIRFEKRFLHYNYVCAILNDVFGIQSRGGCQCSGPYSQRLLGLTMRRGDEESPNARNSEIEHALLHYKERAELLRPGYTRLSLPFKGLYEEEVDYVLKALAWVAQNGWALLCQYRCNHRTGEWRHSNRQGKPLGREERRWLSHYEFPSVSTRKKPPSGPKYVTEESSLTNILDETFANANELLQAARVDQRSIAQALKMADAESVMGKDDDEKLEALRWYVYPRECAVILSKDTSATPDPPSDTILGALRPLGVSCNGGEDVEMLPHCDESTKRDVSASVDESGGVVQPADSMDAETVVCFRDGMHTGEAPLDEIREGIDSGELSEACELFDAASDTWVSCQSFGLLYEEPKTTISQRKQEDTAIPRTSGALDESKGAKKESRDSAKWGEAHPTSSTALVPAIKAETAGELATVKPAAQESASQSSSQEAPNEMKRKRSRHVKPPAKMMRLVTQAVMQWEMLKDGDKLLLGLSGGKDSLSLLHCLLELQRKLPIKFSLEVCTIDPMTPSFDPSPLIPYVESLGLKYHYVRDKIVLRASSSGKDGKIVSSLCAYCARMKRGNLYACARRNNCNKLVLAQHLDDCAESFFMSVMHNGFLRTMKANYQINAGDLAVIRPMVYCRESLMAEFSKSNNLPVINENCPACFEEPKERARIKKLLNREETLFPNFYDNIRRALLPLMHDESTAILRCYTEEVVSKSRKKPRQETHAAEDSEPLDSSTLGTLEPSGQSVQDALRNISTDDLIKELAHRRAEQFRLSGSMKRVDEEGNCDILTDSKMQACSSNGSCNSVPCSELME